MTTLRSFQAEIEGFAHEKQRQAIKDAREAHAAAEQAKHHKTKHEAIKVVEEEVHDDEDETRIEVRRLV